MAERARAALDAGLALGAHPAYPDREGFGRRDLPLPPLEIRDAVRAQCEALLAVIVRAGGVMRHIKLHGALYHRAHRDQAVAEAVADAVIALNPELIVVGLAASRLAEACVERGLAFAREVFADRGYSADGHLLPRGVAGALLAADAAAAQALRLFTDADTLCLHSDSPGAEQTARRIRRALEEGGVAVQPMSLGGRP